MTSFSSITTVLSLFIFFSLSFATTQRHHLHHPSPPHPTVSTAINLACKATRNPPKCEASLLNSNNVPPNPNPTQIIEFAIRVATHKVKAARSMLQPMVDSSAGYLNFSVAVKNSLEILRLSEYRLEQAAEALPRGGIKDARAWMSAVVSYHYDCGSAWKKLRNGQRVKQMVAVLESLIGLTRDALSMMVSYDRFGNDTRKWKPPGTERVGDWEVVDGSGFGLGYTGGLPSGLKAHVTVCKGGGNRCQYRKVQEAVNAVPENLEGRRRFVIRIKEGVYEETVRVPLEKRNVVFLGEGMGKSVITGSLNVGQPGMNTYNTATVVLGDGFMASGLTVKNSAGSQQAVAFRSDSDKSIIENCEFIGNQDTLYAHSLRQFYKSCRIQGNVDFIFGNSASVFQDCLILISSRMGDNNAVTTITAHGRVDPALSTGFIFRNCVVNGTDESIALHRSNPRVHQNYLGRPWKEYSRTVFIICKLEALIAPEGWMPWSGDFALQTLYYGEFNNSGPGADFSRRVTWSSRIPADHVNMYSVQNFIQGDRWIPKS